MSGGIGTALVTGATGFIGSALAARLAAEGTRTVCLVRAESPRKGRLDGLAGVEVRGVESWSSASIARAIEGLAPDVVFHLAASGVSPDARDVESLAEGNVALTNRILTALGEAPPRRFLFAGSCSEYAPAPEGERIREDHPLDPPSLYGAAKAAAALFGKALAARLGIAFVPLRLFGVYGPGEAPSRLVPHLLSHFRAGTTPALTPGEQARDLTYIDDVVEALIAAATANGIEPGHAYNVCSGVPSLVREVALLAARAVGKEGADLGLGRRPYREDEPMWIVGDPARFHEATGWRARVSLEEGIRRMAGANGNS
ncbi:NAD-dependent epimerase/dehydratase family protein [Polyangium aurulentum]|uniref:NAD-dependent epimerase/dehydratase family protein n=1 Tax=Polyangium aurulentum TaxID=2567896 RepID=UPI0010AE4397|nr:NAD(P)-dependent oxidoreductase [Polyangium aurulentum]UQA60254.1 NAD(P)-dependent oxidoreductase [Polyangium aurulentum]